MFAKYIWCCIYKHFPSVDSALAAAKDYDERGPSACRWTSDTALLVLTYRRRLDQLIPNVVCWIPYGDHRSFREFEVISLFSDHLRWGPLTVIHRSETVVRQFGYIQTISPHPIAPSVSIEEMNDRWMQFSDYIVHVGKISVVSGQCSPDYMDWFHMILHPFMSLVQPGNFPRILSVQQYDTFVEPYVHQQPRAAAAPDGEDVDVYNLGHAMDDYVAIANKLERLLNLRILTKGKETYTVAEECLSITRSCISQPTVGHRSRRRWRADGH
ncbi:uncharacterized protein LOC114423982 [Glycine soja]|uniref:uncharacterized protein LOC114423982 n=1 Tax=Glycine soja TaxID=3848 RepID=UPI0010394EBA|nr:uncharacterized protein LOC114423982 [Glycine soja]